MKLLKIVDNQIVLTINKFQPSVTGWKNTPSSVSHLPKNILLIPNKQSLTPRWSVLIHQMAASLIKSLHQSRACRTRAHQRWESPCRAKWQLDTSFVCWYQENCVQWLAIVKSSILEAGPKCCLDNIQFFYKFYLNYFLLPNRWINKFGNY